MILLEDPLSNRLTQDRLTCSTGRQARSIVSAANANRWTKMTQRLFSLVLAGVALGSLAIVGCNDRSSTAPETALESAPAGVVVSNVVTITGSAGSLRTYAAATSEPVAYISAAPGTFPGIPQVFIRNETRGGDVESIVI